MICYNNKPNVAPLKYLNTVKISIDDYIQLKQGSCSFIRLVGLLRVDNVIILLIFMYVTSIR